jgi:hypothetical protein
LLEQQEHLAFRKLEIEFHFFTGQNLAGRFIFSGTTWGESVYRINNQITNGAHHRKLFPTFQQALSAFSRLMSFAAITFAIVDVVPEPVTPGSVWNRSPAANPSMSFFYRLRLGACTGSYYFASSACTHTRFVQRAQPPFVSVRTL